MDMAFQMVIFMLDDAGTNAFKHFLVFLEVLVKILDADLIFTNHFFIDVGQAETTFFKRHIVTKRLKEFRVDKHLLETLAVRVVGVERITVDNEKTN